MSVEIRYAAILKLCIIFRLEFSAAYLKALLAVSHAQRVRKFQKVQAKKTREIK